ncbi:MAG: hypothetical protein IBX71_10490 [Candidatus Desulforudis sp.]|nr:hypothetical protein [Desulforudis sp.]
MPDTGSSRLTDREKRLLFFLRQIGWGDVKIKVENGQPVVVYQTITNHKLTEEEEPGQHGSGTTGKCNA